MYLHKVNFMAIQENKMEDVDLATIRSFGTILILCKFSLLLVELRVVSSLFGIQIVFPKYGCY